MDSVVTWSGAVAFIGSFVTASLVHSYADNRDGRRLLVAAMTSVATIVGAVIFANALFLYFLADSVADALE